MSKLTLELTYDLNRSKKLPFHLTRDQLKTLYSFLCGPSQKTIKIANYYFYYSGSHLGSNTNKEQASKYGCYEKPAEIKDKIRKLLLQ